MTVPRVSFHSIALLVSVGTLWGTTFPLTRFLTGHLDPAWMVSGRLLVGTVALLAFVRLRTLGGARRGVGRQGIRHLAVAGVLNIAIPWCLMAVVLRSVAASVVTIMFAGVGPLLTYAFGVAAGRERWGRRRAFGLALSLAGVVVVSAGAAASSTSPLHLVALAAATLSISIGAVYVATYLRGAPAATVTLGQLMAANAVVAVMCLALGRDAFVGPMTAGVWVAWLVLGVANTALTYLLFFHLLQREGPATAATANYVTVLVGTVTGIAFLAEPVTTSMILGGALILLGMSQSTRPPTPA